MRDHHRLLFFAEKIFFFFEKIIFSSSNEQNQHHSMLNVKLRFSKGWFHPLSETSDIYRGVGKTCFSLLPVEGHSHQPVQNDPLFSTLNFRNCLERIKKTNLFLIFSADFRCFIETFWNLTIIVQFFKCFLTTLIFHPQPPCAST